MKKISTLLVLLLLLIILTTFNPNYFSTDFQLFKIKNIEIKNLKILNEKKNRTVIL